MPVPPRTSFVPGKIILSGEYAMGLIGARGIAVPSAIGLEAIFQPDASLEGLEVDWRDIDDRWKAYLGKIIQACAESRGDALRGRLWIRNALPLGKGMGSSTALVLAICRVLLEAGRDDFARKLEDALNPGHSGMDFAVIREGKPLIFRKGEEPALLTGEVDLPHAVLIDTGAPGESTAELIGWLKSRTDDATLQEALLVIGECTERLLTGEPPLTVFPDHHRAQVALGVVPEQTAAVIARIEASGGAAKVIGAGGRTGGGGMVLAIHPEEKPLAEAIRGRTVIRL